MTKKKRVKRKFKKPQFEWDSLAGAGYIRLSEERVKKTVIAYKYNNWPYVVVDVDETGYPVGVEIIL